MQRIQFTQISVIFLFYFKHLTKTEQCSYNPLQQHKLKSVVDTTTLNTTAIQRHIQNPVKHLRQGRTQSNTQNGASFRKNYFHKIASSQMFHWVRSIPRLLDTSLLHVDTAVPQNLYARRPYAVVFCSRRKKTLFFKNCVAFFILFSNSPHVGTCKKFKVPKPINKFFCIQS